MQIKKQPSPNRFWLLLCYWKFKIRNAMKLQSFRKYGKQKSLCCVILCVALQFMVSCKGKVENEQPSQELKLTTKEDVIPEDGNTVRLVVTANDAMQFDKKELKAKAGQTVLLTLRHKGRMAAHVMGHNLVILNNNVSVTVFGNAAVIAKDTEYIPKKFEQNVIAHTKLIGGGETTTVSFKAPPAGVYNYICSFPGHYALMKGKFIVE